MTTYDPTTGTDSATADEQDRLGAAERAALYGYGAALAADGSAGSLGLRQRKLFYLWVALLLVAPQWSQSGSQLIPAIELAVTMGLIYLAFTSAPPLPPGRNNVMIKLVFATIFISVLGAAASGTGGPNPLTTEVSGPIALVRSVRFFIVVLGVSHLAMHLGMRLVRTGVMYAGTIICLLPIVVSQLGVQVRIFDPLAQARRLTAWPYAIHPNGLGTIAAITVVVMWSGDLRSGLVHPVTERRLRWAASLVCLVCILETASRTSLGAMAIGLALIVGRGSFIKVAGTVLALALLIGATFVPGSPLDGYFGERNQQNATLNFTGRTDAWAVAKDIHRNRAQVMVGNGLTYKTVIVTQEFRNPGGVVYQTKDQAIDNTWIVTYTTMGMIGVALLAAMFVAAIVFGIRMPTDLGSPIAILALALLPVTITTNVLNDVSFSTIAVLGIFACGVTHLSRLRRSSGQSASPWAENVL